MATILLICGCVLAVFKWLRVARVRTIARPRLWTDTAREAEMEIVSRLSRKAICRESMVRRRKSRGQALSRRKRRSIDIENKNIVRFLCRVLLGITVADLDDASNEVSSFSLAIVWNQKHTTRIITPYRLMLAD
jgi:hypothetical protein